MDKDQTTHNEVFPFYIKRPDVSADRPQRFDPASLAAWKYWWDGDVGICPSDAPAWESLDTAQGPPASLDFTVGPTRADVVVKAFCFFYESGVFPPEWIMADLYKRFSIYLKDNVKGKAEADLGKYFDGKKRRTAWKQAIGENLEDKACFAVYVLVRCADVALPKAIEIVTPWLEKLQRELPPGWKSERVKQGPALTAAFKKRRKDLDSIWRAPPPDPLLLHILDSLGSLQSYPSLERQRDGLRTRKSEGNLEPFLLI